MANKGDTDITCKLSYVALHLVQVSIEVSRHDAGGAQGGQAVPVSGAEARAKVPTRLGGGGDVPMQRSGGFIVKPLSQLRVHPARQHPSRQATTTRK